jgi:hypothetical protein
MATIAPAPYYDPFDFDIEADTSTVRGWEKPPVRTP